MAAVDFGGTPINSISEITKSQSDALAKLGFQDAEQVIGAASTLKIKEALADEIGVSRNLIDDFVRKLTDATPSFAAGPAPSPDSLVLGALPPTSETEEIIRSSTPPQFAPGRALPSYVNQSSHLAAPKNQGDRGTCVAFALTAVHEYVRNRTGGPPDFSEQFLYHEIKLIDGSPNECGTWQVKGAQVLQNLGQCPEAIWLYNGKLPCNNNGTRPANARAEAAEYKLNMVILQPRDVQGIKGMLAGGSVVGFSIPVYDSWYRSSYVAQTGRITMRLGNEPATGGHAMCLVGYQDEAAAPGGGYFILRNSWFGVWGTTCPYGSGYGTIPYAYIANENWEAVTANMPVGLS